MAEDASRARYDGLVGGQPPGQLIGLGVAFLGEPVEIADDLLLVELASKLTVALGQFAEKLCGFLHDADVPFGSGKLHLSNAISDSVKHGCSGAQYVIRC